MANSIPVKQSIALERRGAHACALAVLFPKGGGPGLNNWVMAMGDDFSDIAGIAATTEGIAKRFSFRDFEPAPSGFTIDPSWDPPSHRL